MKYEKFNLQHNFIQYNGRSLLHLSLSEGSGFQPFSYQGPLFILLLSKHKTLNILLLLDKVLSTVPCCIDVGTIAETSLNETICLHSLLVNYVMRMFYIDILLLRA